MFVLIDRFLIGMPLAPNKALVIAGVAVVRIGIGIMIVIHTVQARCKGRIHNHIGPRVNLTYSSWSIRNNGVLSSKIRLYSLPLIFIVVLIVSLHSKISYFLV